MANGLTIKIESGQTGSFPHRLPTRVFRALVDGEPAGYLYFTWDHEAQDRPVVHVAHVEVHPAFQRRGISTALHRAAAEWLAKRGDFRLGSGDVVSKENAAFWKKLEAMGLARRAGYDMEWEMLPGALIPNEPAGLLKYRDLPVDENMGSPVEQWGAVHAWRLGTYWTVAVDVPLRDLSGLKAKVHTKERLVSVRRARESGAELPPIEVGVFQDGSAWIVDGNHRLEDARRAHLQTISVRFTFVGQPSVQRNPLLAKPPKASHRLQDTRQFRRLFGRAPRESDYEGVHTTGNSLIAAAYAMGSWNGDPDSYPVIVTLDVSGLDPLPDVDAMVHGAAAADELLPSYRKLVQEDGWTLDSFIEDDDYREADAQVGQEPAAFIFEDVGRHVAQAIRDYADDENLDADEVFDEFLDKGELPSGVLTRLAQQQRYLHDFEKKRVVRIEAVRPWWHQVLFGGDAAEEDEKIAELVARGFHVFSLEDWPFSDPGETITLYEAPNASRRQDIEYHGTTSAVIHLAFPGIIPEESPFSVEGSDE